ncbi:MAG TPA: hypothetical protein VFE24_15320 [Pirellulales bacterium]|jgi:hypothetical protein|nr:hypothetical protein [Pirellulales bacterium]
MSFSIGPLNEREPITPAMYYALWAEIHRLQNVAAAPPLRILNNAGGLTIGLARELPQFDFVEIGTPFAAGDEEQTVTRLFYRPDDAPPDLFGKGPDPAELQHTADPQQGLYLGGERHLTYFHPGAGQRIPIPGVQFHLGKMSEAIAPADPAHPEIVPSGAVDVWQYDRAGGAYGSASQSVTAYDWFGHGIDAGTAVYLYLHNQSRRWYAIPQAQSTATVRWGLCQANWTYTGGVYPSQGGHGRVSVQACDDSVGSNPHGAAIVVYLPNGASGDPNLVAGDVIAFVLADNGTPVCISAYLDDPIGTVKMFTGSSAQVRPGWACMAGGDESKHLNGASWNMEDRFARHSCSDGKVGTTGGSDTHDHTGVTGYNETGITIDDHPDHVHPLTSSYLLDIRGDLSGKVITDLAGYTEGVHDNTASHDPLVLTHNVVDEGHAHTLAADSNIPAYRYLRFIERIDNSS